MRHTQAQKTTANQQLKGGADMPRQTTQPPIHDPLQGPDAPFSDEELDVLHGLGRDNGGRIVNAIRAAITGQFTINVAAPVVNCTHPGCNGGPCNVVVHTDDDNMDVLFAFLVSLVVFFVSWLALRGQLTGWDEPRWPAVIGFATGFLWLAVSSGVRRIWQ